jgi:type I restriction enzyme, S subunit
MKANTSYMELKQGYKLTEVGVIPEDWEVARLGDIFNFKNGLNKEKQYFGQGTPIVNYMDVYYNRSLTSDKLDGRVTLTTQEIKNYEVKKGDVFFTRTSETVDEIGITSVLLDEVKNTVFSGFVLRARSKKDGIHTSFLKYCFSTLSVRKEIIKRSSYTTRALINGKQLSEVKFVLPTLTEQTAIATALSDADSYIQSLDQLIDKKRLLKQGAMQELLKPKEGWVVKKLGVIGAIVTGSTPSTQIKEYWNGSIPWITPTDISNFSKDIYFSEREVSDIGLAVLRKLPANTLLVTCIASIGKNAILRKIGSCNQQINAIIPFEEYNIEFLYYLFESSKGYLMSKAGITATLIISKKEFAEIEFSFPAITEQTRIATILTEMDNEIQLLEKQLEKANQIKQGMMQELLTGKTRLV